VIGRVRAWVARRRRRRQLLAEAGYYQDRADTALAWAAVDLERSRRLAKQMPLSGAKLRRQAARLWERGLSAQAKANALREEAATLARRT